jgi:hypothetical protein
MDTSVLVNQAQVLTKLLDDTIVRPQAVMWVHHQDTDTWKLWIVPSSDVIDKREFYRIVAQTISDAGGRLQGLDVGMTEFVSDTHPAMQGMSNFLRLEGVGGATFTGNRFNDFYLPDGIVIRMALERDNPAPAMGF